MIVGSRFYIKEEAERREFFSGQGHSQSSLSFIVPVSKVTCPALTAWLVFIHGCEPRAHF